MKFTVEIDDFYLEEGEISLALQNHVVNSVKNQIWESIKAKVDTQITMRVKEEVETQMYKHINNCLAESMKDIKIKHNGVDLALENYIGEKLKEPAAWNNTFVGQIQKVGKMYADEFKLRYDKIFAAGIVDAMLKNNLLKEDVVKSLTQKSE